MSLLGIILLVALILFVIGALPSVGMWDHDYGAYPSGIGGILLLVLIVLLFTGRI